MYHNLKLPIPLPKDLKYWTSKQYHAAALLTQKLIHNEVSNDFKRYFDYETINIEYNEKTNFIYLYDKYINYAMIINDQIEIVDALGNIKDFDNNNLGCLAILYQ
jgi:hypothetical protein